MKKIFVRIGVTLGVLVLIALMGIVFVRKKSAECGKGQGSVAIEACTLLINNFPMEAAKYVYLGFRRGHYAVAGAKQAELDDLATMIKMAEGGSFPISEESKASLYEKAAEAYAKNSDKAGSLAAAEKAIQLGSKNGAVYMMRGLARLEAEKYADAVADFKTAEGLGFQQLQLYMNLGSALLGATDYENAYQVLKKSEGLAAAPQDIGLINRQLGLTSFELKRYPEAVDHMTKALLAGPCPECSAIMKMSQDFINKARQPVKKTRPAVKKKTRRR